MTPEQTGVIGTSFYISPEIAEGWPQHDEKVDMYSLGIIVFELWHPFTTGMERVELLRDLRQLGKLPRQWEADHSQVLSSPSLQSHLLLILAALVSYSVTCLHAADFDTFPTHVFQFAGVLGPVVFCRKMAVCMSGPLFSGQAFACCSCQTYASSEELRLTAVSVEHTRHFGRCSN